MNDKLLAYPIIMYDITKLRGHLRGSLKLFKGLGVKNIDNAEMSKWWAGEPN